MTDSLGLMAGQGMLLPAPLGDRCLVDMLLSASLGTVMLGRFHPGMAAGASCKIVSHICHHEVSMQASTVCTVRQAAEP